MFKSIKNKANLIKDKSFKNLILFDFLYQLSFILILMPFGKEIFSVLYRFTKEGFFSIDNVKNFVISPIKLTSILILILIFSCLRLFEISGFIFTINQIRINNDVSTIEIFNNSYKFIKLKAKKLKNILIFLPIIFGIPISSLSHKRFILPSFITEYVFSMKFGILIYLILLLIKFILSVKLIFVLNVYLLENKNFFESVSISFNRIRKKFFKGLKVIFIIYIKNIFLELVKLGLLFSIIYIFYNQTENKTISNVNIIIYLSIATFIKVFTNIIGNFIAFNGISKFYFSFDTKDITNKVYKSNKIGLKFSITLIFLILFSSVSKYRNSIEEINFYHSLKSLKPIVMAHRGATEDEAENTMESINKAIELKAEFAEIDVHLTKDNVVVLCHDNNIKRLTNQKGKISDLTFNQLKSKPILYNKKKFNFVDLKTVLKRTSGKIKLNIELKPVNGNEKKLVKEVSKLIKDKNHEVIISSLSTKALKEMKNIRPDISTGLILAVAYGNFYNIPYIDFFCIEEQVATTENIRKIKQKNKLVYVWTVNNKDSIKSLCKKGINGIITDEVKMSKKIIEKTDFNFNELILYKILNLLN